MPDNLTYDRSNDEIEWGDEIPFDGSPLPTPAPDFRPGDHVRSIKSNRLFGIIEIHTSGALHLWSHRWGHIYRADPRRWHRLPRNEELAI